MKLWSTVFVLLIRHQALLVQSYKVVSVTPVVEAHLQILSQLEEQNEIEIDFWTRPSQLNQTVDIEVSDEDFEKLSLVLKEHAGMEFTIQIDNLQQLINEQLEQNEASARNDNWHARYHPLNEITDKLEEMRRSSGGLAEIFELGKKGKGRKRVKRGKGKKKTLPAIKISIDDNKPVFFIQCGIHAREWISPATCMYIIDQMIQKSSSDASVMLNKMSFVILPVFNPDGYEYTWTSGGRMWRKNRRKNKKSSRCVGVDLNRNWSYEWGGEGASPNKCDETYRGKKAFSEKETKSVSKYLEGLNKQGLLKGFIDFHAFSQMWFIPWGYTATKTNDHEEQMRVAKIAVEAIKRKHGKSYKYGSSAVLLYKAAGGSEDWTYGSLGVKYSFTVELPPRDANPGFILPPSQIITTGEEIFEGLKALVIAMEI
ncbi:carboxypeptidase B-like [Porites lutea]|uniref:carboxypeptidase B-like n=1 Tax=Porites lutea TaxID=51062 RepID=UPI003CC58A65